MKRCNQPTTLTRWCTQGVAVMECKSAFKIHILNRHDGKFYTYEPQAQCPLLFLKLKFSKKVWSMTSCRKSFPGIRNLSGVIGWCSPPPWVAYLAFCFRAHSFPSSLHYGFGSVSFGCLGPYSYGREHGIDQPDCLVSNIRTEITPAKEKNIDQGHWVLNSPAKGPSMRQQQFLFSVYNVQGATRCCQETYKYTIPRHKPGLKSTFLSRVKDTWVFAHCLKPNLLFQARA